MGNVLIDTLPLADRERIVPLISTFAAEATECLVLRGSEVETILFPLDGLFSTTAQVGRGDVYEVAASGRRGMVGAELALGAKRAARAVTVQVDGSSGSMTRATFFDCLDQSEAFTRAVHRHLRRTLFVAEQSVACGFAHSLSERCARWMLMLHDEVGRDEFGLRNEFLGMMLGTKPAETDAAADILGAGGAVRYEGEVLTFLDVESLGQSACECYEAQRRFDTSSD